MILKLLQVELESDDILSGIFHMLRTKNIGTAIFLCILTIAIAFWVLCAKGFSLYVPFVYANDGLFSGEAIKSIIDTGWFLHNPYLGAPGIFSQAEYPVSDQASFLIIKLIALFTQDYALIINIFYLLTYPLTALAAFIVLRKFNMRTELAFAASIVYTFIPFHMLRGESHLFLTVLYVIPIYLWLAFEVYEKKSLAWIASILLSILCAASGVYYAFFASYLLFITGILGCLYQRSYKPFLNAFSLIVVIVSVVIINISPSIIASHRNGVNTELANRQALESELYGLKVTQLLLPIDDHRVHPFKIKRQDYDRTAPNVTENAMSSLGLIGSIGFIICLCVLFWRERLILNRWYLLSRLNIAAVMLGTVGSLGTLFAYLISPSIRAYNRIGVFIAFMAIAAFFTLIEWWVSKRKFKNITVVFIAAMLILLGLFDQVGTKRFPNYVAANQAYKSDAQFVKQMEAVLPQNSAVFELPVVPFPENPAVNKMGDYELFKSYMHSHHLHWSYGAIKGRKVLAWQQAISRLPIDKMLEQLVYAGFSGIYIDRNGYADNAKQIETELNNTLKVKPIVSHDNTLVFYDLRDYANKLKQSMSSDVWQAKVASINHELSYEMKWFAGFHSHEDVLDQNRTAKEPEAIIRIVNYDTKPIDLKIAFDVVSDSPVIAAGDLLGALSEVQHVNTVVSVSPGVHFITLKKSSKLPMADERGKKVYFKIKDVIIE